MSDFVETGEFTEETKAEVSAWNTPQFNFKMEVTCKKCPDTDLVVANGEFTVNVTQRTDNSVTTSISVWGLEDLEADKGWDEIEGLGNALLELAANGREKTKSLLGDKYGMTLSEQAEERNG